MIGPDIGVHLTLLTIAVGDQDQGRTCQIILLATVGEGTIQDLAPLAGRHVAGVIAPIHHTTLDPTGEAATNPSLLVFYLQDRGGALGAMTIVIHQGEVTIIAINQGGATLSLNHLRLSIGGAREFSH